VKRDQQRERGRDLNEREEDRSSEEDLGGWKEQEETGKLITDPALKRISTIILYTKPKHAKCYKLPIAALLPPDFTPSLFLPFPSRLLPTLSYSSFSLVLILSLSLSLHLSGSHPLSFSPALFREAGEERSTERESVEGTLMNERKIALRRKISGDGKSKKKRGSLLSTLP
jgi:hypothetical protein